MGKRKNTPTNPSMQKETLELEKLQLELEGLRHPIKSSFKSFNWKDVVAIVVASGGVLLAVWTGLFNVRQERLSVTNERLRLEQMQLEQGNNELAATRSRLEGEQASLQEELRITKEQLGLHDEEWATIEKIRRGIPNSRIVTKVELTGDGDQFGFGVLVHRLSFAPWSYGSEPEAECDPRLSELLEGVQSVQRLSLCGVTGFQLSKKDISCIARPSIVELRLVNNRLTDEMLEPIAELSQLTALMLGGNKGTRHPQALTYLTSLTFLNLAKTSFDDEGLALLRPLSNSLENLFLQSTEVSDEGLQHLQGFTALQSLDLTNCKNVTGPGLTGLVNLPSLKYLAIDGCGIDEDGHKSLLESLRQQNPSLIIEDYFGEPPVPQPKAAAAQ